MLHHVSVGVTDVLRAADFYDAVLGALGYKRTAQYLPYAIAYGEGVSEFWIQIPHDKNAPRAGNGAHFGFAARNQDAVHRFHATALANGGRDDGAPGPRPDYGPDYYGAFVYDPFGNKIEAVFVARKSKPPGRRQSNARPARKADTRRSSPTKKGKRAKKAQTRKARRR